MIHFVHKGILNQELGQRSLAITCIQVEGETPFQNQHLYMYQFMNRY